MKKLLEVIGVFVVGAVAATVMSVCGQTQETPPVDSIPGPTPQVASSPAASSPVDPPARTVECPKCGEAYRVVGKQPHEPIECSCGACLNLSEGDGHSLKASVVETKPVVDIVADEPEKTPELAGPPPEINWRKDFEAARAEAIRTGKRLLVVQTKTVGCVPCEELKKYVFSDPRVVKYVNENCVACLVVDRQMFPGQSFSFPAMWLRLPSGGGVLWRGPRYKGERAYPIPKEPEAFIAAIEKASAA